MSKYSDMPRMDLMYLGKVIGTCSGWDHPADHALLFCDYSPNDLGKAFHPEFLADEYDSLSIDTETGDVVLYIVDTDSGPIEVVNWSIFNREKREDKEKEEDSDKK